jgi:hypothetical protein
MKSSLDDTLISVWRQAMIENADAVTLGTESYPVTNSRAKRLRQVAFDFEGNTIMGIEQNPTDEIKRAAMARSGKKVMQFLKETTSTCYSP